MNSKTMSMCSIVCGIFFLALLFTGTHSVSAAGNFKADPVTGCKVWNVDPQPDETFTWTGGCKDGYLDGNGIFQWIVDGKAGSKYEGSFIQGKKQGKGISVFGPTTSSAGDRYEGDYYDGLRHGKGIYLWANGIAYEGDWLNDIMTGKGILTWVSGSRYEGDFWDNKMHGYGVYTYADGRVQRGRFENGKYVGP